MSDATPPPSAPPSPLLHLPGAVGGNGIDAPVAAHYGSFNGEQRTLVGGDGFVDLSHRGVIRVSGPDRLTWLHSLTTQHLEGLQPGVPTATLVPPLVDGIADLTEPDGVDTILELRAAETIPALEGLLASDERFVRGGVVGEEIWTDELLQERIRSAIVALRVLPAS